LRTDVRVIGSKPKRIVVIDQRTRYFTHIFLYHCAIEVFFGILKFICLGVLSFVTMMDFFNIICWRFYNNI